MAIITLAAPISGIRGKVGGVIYSANKAGPYLKHWSRGSNPRSTIQTEHRSKLVAFSISWSDLSTLNKDGWATYAALPAQDLVNSLGETYSISGFNWYVRINLNRLSAGDGTRDEAPTTGVPTAPTIDFVEAFPTSDSAITNITLTSGSAGLGERMVIKAVLMSSKGRTVQAEVRTFMLTQELDIAELVFPFKDELLEHFGTAQESQRVFCTIQQQSSQGRRSVIASGTALVLPSGPFMIFQALFTVDSDTNITAYVPDLGTGFDVVRNVGSGELEILAVDDFVTYTVPSVDDGVNAAADVFYPSPDYYVQATLNVVGAGDVVTNLFVRFQNLSNVYFVEMSSDDISLCKIYRRVAGTTTEVGSLSQVIADGSVVRFSIVGDDLEVYDDDVLIGSATVTGIASAHRGGFGFGRGFGIAVGDIDNQELDDFEIWSL